MCKVRRARRSGLYGWLLFALLVMFALTALGLSSGASVSDASGEFVSAAATPTPLCPIYPAGAEFLVNAKSSVASSQPSTAVDADGDFVVAWARGGGIYAQRFDAEGARRGGEFRVDDGARNSHSPSVSMSAGGDFVVAWVGVKGTGVSNTEVHVRRYSADGSPRGAEFRADSYPSVPLFELSPSVACDAAGGFVVAWLAGHDGRGPGVYARRFDAAGDAEWPAVLVTRPEYFPTGAVSVATDPTGSLFVVAWEGTEAAMAPGEAWPRVYARSYMGAGYAWGPALRAGTFAGRSGSNPSVAVAPDGHFVVAWESRAAGSDQIVNAQSFDYRGVARSRGEFQVSDGASEPRANPSVAADAGGGFAVAWSEGTTYDAAVYARRFDAEDFPAGGQQGLPFRVGDGADGGRTAGALASDARGNLVVVSTSIYAPSDVYARRFAVACPEPSPTPTPSLQVMFGVPSYDVTEGCVPAYLNVQLLGQPTGQEVTVDYTVTGGSATQRSDFTYAAGTAVWAEPAPGTAPQGGRLTFAPGETNMTVEVLVNDDGYAEGRETVFVTLSNPSGAALGPNATATLYINDDETVDSQKNPIDDPMNFVCQHYHDFLHRQPDPSGHAFWAEQIMRCGADAACVGEMRHNVSAAFFLSIEYQQTGYIVERLYDACLGRRPSFEEFMRDVHRLGFGVQVGLGDWGQRLERNKRAFALEFVGRPEFKARYPEGMSADSFVNLMFWYAGNSPPPADVLQSALDAYGVGDAEGRARATRVVMESAGVYRVYYNRGFVLAEYFGYLRRNPAAAPDTDWSGYDYWLRKMDAHSLPGEDVTREDAAFARVKRGEMVRAFIVSEEYRRRFGRP
ncbi:MAG TPA: Calx-beta domain-containing protein [Pyrinomonadaceae bacterium]